MTRLRILTLLFAVTMAVPVYADAYHTPDWVFDPDGQLNPMTVGVEWTLKEGQSGFEKEHWDLDWDHGPAIDPYTMWDGDPDIFPLRNDQSVPPGTTRFTLLVPNWVDNLPDKFFFIEIDVVSMNPPPTILTAWGEKGSVEYPTIYTWGSFPLTADYENCVYYGGGVFHPNPEREYIVIDVPDYSGGGNAEGFTVYTLSIPEPATVSALMLGALTVLRRRRK